MNKDLHYKPNDSLFTNREEVTKDMEHRRYCVEHDKILKVSLKTNTVLHVSNSEIAIKR